MVGGLDYEHMKELGLDGKVEICWSKHDKKYENMGLWKKIVPVGEPSQILISLYQPKYRFVGRTPFLFGLFRKSVERNFDSRRIGKVIEAILRNKPDYFTHYCRGDPYYFDSPEFEIKYEVMPISFFVEEEQEG